MDPNIHYLIWRARQPLRREVLKPRTWYLEVSAVTVAIGALTIAALAPLL